MIIDVNKLVIPKSEEIHSPKLAAILDLLICRSGYIREVSIFAVSMFPGPMFPSLYVPRSYVPRHLCFPAPMFPGHIWIKSK